MKDKHYLYIILGLLVIARCLPTSESEPDLTPTPIPRPLTTYKDCSSFYNREAIEAGQMVRVIVFVDLDNPEEGRLDSGVDEYYLTVDGVKSERLWRMPPVGFDCDIISSLFLEVWANDTHDIVTCSIRVRDYDRPGNMRVVNSETKQGKVTCQYSVP